jgi:hypothetical protein
MTDTLTIHVPMAFRQRGGRKLIVAPDGMALPATASRCQVDNVLVKALARAFRWQKLLDAGTYNTIKEISAKEKVDPSYVGDVLRLNLLAPDIVGMILDGRQPRDLQFKHLRKCLVAKWEVQRVVLRAGGPREK